MPPKVGGRGRGANYGRSIHRVRLVDISQPHRDHAFAPPPLKRVADHVLPESRDEHEDFVSHGNISGAYSTAPHQLLQHMQLHLLLHL